MKIFRALWERLSGQRYKQLEQRIMKAEEAIAALEQANKDHAEAFVEINAEFSILNSRIAELEEMVNNGDVPEALAAKILEVSAGAKSLADVIPNAPVPPPEA